MFISWAPELGLHVEGCCTSQALLQFLGDNTHKHTVTPMNLMTMTGMYIGIIHNAARIVHTRRLSMNIHGLSIFAYMLYNSIQYSGVARGGCTGGICSPPPFFSPNDKS